MLKIFIFNFFQDAGSSSSDATTKEPLCKKKLHMKVLERGIPDDAMVGILNIKVCYKFTSVNQKF